MIRSAKESSVTDSRNFCMIYLYTLSCVIAVGSVHSFPTRRSSDLDQRECGVGPRHRIVLGHHHRLGAAVDQDRKSTRLNSSHVKTSYAVFCLKKKKSPLKSRLLCRMFLQYQFGG